MKPTNTPLKPARESEYALIEYEFPFTSLIETAMQLDTSPQRASRLLRILQIPIHRIGSTILLDNAAVHRLRDAIESNEVRRGRKRKSDVTA